MQLNQITQQINSSPICEGRTYQAHSCGQAMMIAPDRLYVGDMAGQITVNLHPYNYGVESTFCSTKDADDLKNLVSEPFDSMDIISDCMVND